VNVTNGLALFVPSSIIQVGIASIGKCLALKSIGLVTNLSPYTLCCFSRGCNIICSFQPNGPD
jgi:hypothetical protein